MKNMTTITSFLLLISFSIFNTACKKDQNFDKCDCSSSIIVSDNKLFGKWDFESFETLSEKKEYPPSSLNKMTIEISDSTTVIIAKGQNNTCTGNYTVYENNCINIYNLACTEIGGTKEQLEWEEKYWEALNNSECYDISASSLVIYYKHNNKYKIMNLKK